MKKIFFAAILSSVTFVAYAQTFGGFQCQDYQCSGHKAGYDWAYNNSIIDEMQCVGNSQSFIEGCVAYARSFSQQQPNSIGTMVQNIARINSQRQVDPFAQASAYRKDAEDFFMQQQRVNATNAQNAYLANYYKQQSAELERYQKQMVNSNNFKVAVAQQLPDAHKLLGDKRFLKWAKNNTLNNGTTILDAIEKIGIANDTQSLPYVRAWLDEYNQQVNGNTYKKTNTPTMKTVTPIEAP